MDRVLKAVYSKFNSTSTYVALGSKDIFQSHDHKATQEALGKFAKFIPSNLEAKRFQKLGYYSYPMQMSNGTMIPKTKIISLNTNLCYEYNWDSMISTNQKPQQMLSWFENELQTLESINGSAVILSSIPNINECNR